MILLGKSTEGRTITVDKGERTRVVGGRRHPWGRARSTMILLGKSTEGRTITVDKGERTRVVEVVVTPRAAPGQP